MTAVLDPLVPRACIRVQIQALRRAYHQPIQILPLGFLSMGIHLCYLSSCQSLRVSDLIEGSHLPRHFCTSPPTRKPYIRRCLRGARPIWSYPTSPASVTSPRKPACRLPVRAHPTFRYGAASLLTRDDYCCRIDCILRLRLQLRLLLPYYHYYD